MELLISLKEKQLQLPNSYFSDVKYFYKVTDRVDGDSLCDYLKAKKKGIICETEAKVFIFKIQNTLKNCHINKLYHNNINDTNIFIRGGKHITVKKSL